MWDSTHLRKARIATGLSQVEFASYAGVNATTYGHWERGNGKPNEHNRQRLCRVLSQLTGSRVRWEDLDG